MCVERSLYRIHITDNNRLNVALSFDLLARSDRPVVHLVCIELLRLCIGVDMSQLMPTHEHTNRINVEEECTDSLEQVDRKAMIKLLYT